MDNKNQQGSPSRQPSPERASAPRAKKKKWKAGCFLYIIGVIFISVVLSFFALTMGNDVFGLVKPDKEFTIVVTKDDDLSDVGKMLKKEGAIQYPFLFSIYGGMKDVKVAPGTYNLACDMPYSMIFSKIRLRDDVTARDTVTITIPEGYELRMIIELLADKKVASEEELWETANTYRYKHEFFKEVPERESRLEGYLFPDTYQFYVGDNPVNVFNKMLNNFNDKFTSEYYDRAEELGMSVDDVINLASLIEREAANADERGLVASVFHNRLNNKDYPYLESCASVQYILEERKPILSVADTRIKSPYNTYLNSGLPVGPIASPGLASIEAALYPPESEYFYFVANPNGENSLFAKTYDEHLANIEKANG